MNQIYIIDPVVISLLFKTTDDEEIALIHTDLTMRVMTMVNGIVKNFLLEKGVNEELVNKYGDNIDVNKDAAPDNSYEVPAEIEKYLGDPELGNLVQLGTNQLLKLFYDEALKELNDDDKKTLKEYLANYEKTVNTERKVVKEILDEAKNKTQTVEPVASLQTTAAVPTSPATQVNLGGLKSSADTTGNPA